MAWCAIRRRAKRVRWTIEQKLCLRRDEPVNTDLTVWSAGFLVYSADGALIGGESADEHRKIASIATVETTVGVVK